MSKRKLTGSGGEEDPMSRRNPNYWTYGLVLRRTLDEGIFVDGVLNVVLDFCPPYLDPRLRYVAVRHSLSSCDAFIGMYTSFFDAQIAILIYKYFQEDWEDWRHPKHWEMMPINKYKEEADLVNYWTGLSSDERWGIIDDYENDNFLILER